MRDSQDEGLKADVAPIVLAVYQRGFWGVCAKCVKFLT